MMIRIAFVPSPGEDPTDISQIILRESFEMLTDYVDFDKAWKYRELSGEKHPWYASFFTFRRSDQGLHQLDKEIALKLDNGEPSKTASIAKEIKDLYLWWNQRHMRPDPYYVNDDLDKADHEAEIQKAEDQSMYMKLAAIRPHLWT